MNLAATLRLNNAGFVRPLAAAQGALLRFAAPLAAVGGVSLSVAGALRGLRDALDLGGRLSDVEARTSIAVSQLVLLEQAFTAAGVSGAAVAPTINLMQRALAGITETGESTEDVFRRLGLNMARLRSESPLEQFLQITERIRALPTQAEQAAAAARIFGRSGADLLPFVKDAKALEEAALVVGRQGEILARNAAQFDRASDILSAAPLKLRGFFVGAAESISASMLSVLEQLNQVDLSGIGQRLGQAIAPYLEALKSGAIGDVIGLQITRGLSIAAAKLAQLVAVDLPSMFLAAMTAAIKVVGDELRAKFGVFGQLAQQVGLGALGPTGRLVELLRLGTQPRGQAADPRSFREVFNDILARAPSVDWGRAAANQFAPAIEALMRPFRDAAAQSLGQAQELSAPPAVTRGDLGPQRLERDQASPASDRLARIGGFIGAGGPALEYARRTADNTARLVQQLRTLPRDISAGIMQGSYDGARFA